MTTEEIKELHEQGLSLSQIAEKAGVTSSAISYRLNGKRTPKYKAYQRAYQRAYHLRVTKKKRQEVTKKKV